jgi:hypothetical protein
MQDSNREGEIDSTREENESCRSSCSSQTRRNSDRKKYRQHPPSEARRFTGRDRSERPAFFP